MTSASSRQCLSRHPQEGFILILTIAVIAIGLLASSFIARWIEGEVDKFDALSSSFQQKLDNYDTLSTIIYFTATRPVTYAGIASPEPSQNSYSLPMNDNGDIMVSRLGNELRLDNRLYQGIGNSLFQLQDESGLISVNTLTESRLRQLFSIAGIERGMVKSALSKLSDYIDSDNDYRPDGGELRQYQEAGFADPANRSLRTPEELAMVLGWQEIISRGALNRWSSFLTSRPVVPININTAPRESLLVLGLSPQDIERVINFRETQDISFANIGSLLPVVNQSFDVDQFQYYASRSLRVSIRTRESSVAEVYYLQISTQFEGEKPWSIRYKTSQYTAPPGNNELLNKTGKTIFDGQLN